MIVCVFAGRGDVLDVPDGKTHIWGVKLSNKGRYGVCAMFDIAFHNDGGPTQIKDIAQRQAIPPRFLEQIFQDLKRAGLVTSKRGPRGGYALAQPAGDIRVGDIVRALEGVTQIEADGDEMAGGDPLSRRVTQLVFEELSASIEACFDAVNLNDLCARSEADGVRRGPPRRYVYSI